MPMFTSRLAAACVVGGLTLGFAGPAVAQDDTPAPSTDLGDAAARCQEQIDRRLDDLATAQARVADVDALTDTHKATINSIIDGTEAGLAETSIAIDAATDRATLVDLCTSIATDFRVYLVVLPQTHLTVGADRVDAAVDRGDELVAELDAAIAAALEAGADVGPAQALRDEAVAHLAAASAGVDGAGDQVLTVTPASWNDGDGAPVIEGTRTAVRAAHAEIKAAIEDGHAAVESLRDARGTVDAAA